MSESCVFYTKYACLLDTTRGDGQEESSQRYQNDQLWIWGRGPYKILAQMLYYAPGCNYS